MNNPMYRSFDIFQPLAEGHKEGSEKAMHDTYEDAVLTPYVIPGRSRHQVAPRLRDNQEIVLSPLSMTSGFPSPYPIRDLHDKEDDEILMDHLANIDNDVIEAFWAKWVHDPEITYDNKVTLTVTVPSTVRNNKEISEYLHENIDEIIKNHRFPEGDVTPEIITWSQKSSPTTNVVSHDIEEDTRWFAVSTHPDAAMLPCPLDWCDGKSSPEEAKASRPLDSSGDHREIIAITRHVANDEAVSYKEDIEVTVTVRVTVTQKVPDTYGYFYYGWTLQGD